MRHYGKKNTQQNPSSGGAALLFNFLRFSLSSFQLPQIINRTSPVNSRQSFFNEQ